MNHTVGNSSPVNPSTASAPVSCTSSMNPWHLQQLRGWPLAAGALSLCLVFFGCFFGFRAPSALLGSAPGSGLMSGAGGKEVQAFSCRNHKSCPQHKRCKGQKRKPVGSSLSKILCCDCCKSPKSCIKSTALNVKNVCNIMNL